MMYGRGKTDSGYSFLSEHLQPCVSHQGREVSHMLKAIHSQENRNAADRKARAIFEVLRAGRMNTAIT